MTRRRTFADIRVDTIVDERAGVLAFAREQRLALARLADAGRVPRAEADMLAQRIAAFADGIATGLHRDGRDPPGVRARMRGVVRTHAGEQG